MFKKIITASVLAATLAGASLISTGSAEAHWHGNGGGFGAGLVGGLVGGALLGAVATDGYYGNDGYYDDGPSCFVRHRRVWDTPHSYHFQNVTVCR